MPPRPARCYIALDAKNPQFWQPPTPKIGLWLLVAANIFMVPGGPYGLEELIQKSGYTTSIFILLTTPLFWSLPNALMVGDLALQSRNRVISTRR